jgi:hypothetical protein
VNGILKPKKVFLQTQKCRVLNKVTERKISQGDFEAIDDGV